jgi:hypothetical protein
MLAMRILIAAIIVSFSIAVARAADLPIDSPGGYSTYAPALGERVAPLVIYDYQPGVVVRAYWQAPWRHRHYYPRTGEKPEIGRDEDLSAPYESYEPAKTFKRYWSNASHFPSVRPIVSRTRAEPSQIPVPLK